MLGISAATLTLAGCFSGFEPGHKTTSSSTSISSVANVSLSSPAEQFSTQSRIRLVGQCTRGLSVNISGDIETIVQDPCSDGSFSTDVQLSNGEGLKTIRVSQVGSNGVESSASRIFIRDNTAPVISLVTPSANQNTRRDVIVQGACESDLDVNIAENGMNHKIQCANSAFSTTISLTSADGTVPLALSQTDSAGNRGVVSVSLRKDTVAPVITITAPANNSNVTSQANIRGACESGVAVQISGNGVSAPAMDECLNNTYDIPIVFTAGVGAKAIVVNQTDAAGNSASVTRSFNRQADLAPAIAITAPTANMVFRNNLTVSGTCQTGLTVNFSGSGWMSPASTSCNNGTFSTAITFTSGDGTKNLIASQTNAQNLTGSASRSFIRDNTAPTVTIASPAANTPLPTAVQLTGACETGLAVQISGAGAAATSSATCSNGAYSANVNFSSGEGAKALQVSQTDLAGNVGMAARSFIRDSIAPAVTITSPAADTSHATGLTLAGTCEGVLPVVVSGSGVSSSVTRNCASNTYSIDILFSNGDGSKLVQVSQTDAAGNNGTASRTFVRSPPALDGAALYAQYCAACHGALASSTKQNRTLTQISTAINTVSQMSSLTGLTTAQRQAIADALYVAPNQPAFACDPSQTLEARSVVKGIKRLTRRQYINTLNDLLGRAFTASVARGLVNSALTDVALPADDNSLFSRFDSAVVRQHMKGYFDISHALANTVAASANYPTFVSAFINLDRGGCTAINTSSLGSTCASRFIANFGYRVLRRPLISNSEVDEPAIYLATYNAAGGNAAGINAVVFKFLMAPQFLYHIENDAVLVSGQLYRISSHAVASRLSYMFWNSMPDETLLQQARSANLADNGSFATALAYVADHANAQDSVREFMNEWLKLHQIPHFQTNNPTLNYLANGLSLNASLRTAMIEEVEELGSYVYRQNLTFNDLFTTNVSFARDSRLMSIYGLTTAAPAYVTPANAIHFPDGQRSGLLTRGALLIGGSELANPVKRGLHVRRDILCLSLENPPSDLTDALEPPPPNVNMTTRQRYDNATSPAVCMNCHQHINPLGHAFSAFNSFGKFQTQEPTFDNTGTFSGRYLAVDSQVDLAIALGTGLRANNALEFSNLVASHRNARICASEKALLFAEGRNANRDKEGCRLNKLYGHLVQAHSLKDFMKSVAEDTEFRHRLMGN